MLKFISNFKTIIMKKKNLKNLSLNKSSISNLDAVSGGAASISVFICTGLTFFRTCTVLTANDCGTYNSVNRCQTIEVDRFTRPIC